MIIICPSCKKKFDVNESIIPDKGRLLKCGFCEQTWFFHKNDQSVNKLESDIKPKDNSNINIPKKKNNLENDNKKILEKKDRALVKYQQKKTFKFSTFLSYLIVSIISFIGLIIILDTFKSPLSNFFPNLELILFNLFETLKDILLFMKDLINYD